MVFNCDVFSFPFFNHSHGLEINKCTHFLLLLLTCNLQRLGNKLYNFAISLLLCKRSSKVQRNV